MHKVNHLQESSEKPRGAQCNLSFETSSDNTVTQSSKNLDWTDDSTSLQRWPGVILHLPPCLPGYLCRSSFHLSSQCCVASKLSRRPRLVPAVRGTFASFHLVQIPGQKHTVHYTQGFELLEKKHAVRRRLVINITILKNVLLGFM